MKTNIFRLVILLVVLAELAWFVLPSHKPLMGDSYRNRERMEALNEDSHVHTPATWLAAQNEIKLLYEHDSKRKMTVMAILVVLDAALIFFFWNFGKRNKIAAPSESADNKAI
jgi:hypothetical protein